MSHDVLTYARAYFVTIKPSKIKGSQSQIRHTQGGINIEVKAKKTRTRRKAIVIPEGATPIEIFMLTKGFHWGEITAITKLSKDVLLGIIQGDMPTEEQRKIIRLTTGVRV